MLLLLALTVLDGTVFPSLSMRVHASTGDTWESMYADGGWFWGSIWWLGQQLSTACGCINNRLP